MNLIAEICRRRQIGQAVGHELGRQAGGARQEGRVELFERREWRQQQEDHSSSSSSSSCSGGGQQFSDNVDSERQVDQPQPVQQHMQQESAQFSPLHRQDDQQRQRQQPETLHLYLITLAAPTTTAAAAAATAANTIRLCNYDADSE